MRIGIMLRHMDQHGGGVLVYTRNLLRELLALETDHEFVLMYRNSSHLGSYADGRRVREVAAGAPHRFVWDQLVAPRLARREGVDVLFNPKYSVPLLTDVPTVWVSHGMYWYMEPEWSPWVDRLNHKFLIPLFANRAARIIAVSDTTREGVIEYLGKSPDAVETVYLGVTEMFFDPVPEERLDEVRRSHGLPGRFLLYVGQIYPPKNFGRLVRAFARIGPEFDVSLVVAGTHTSQCESEIDLVEDLGVSDRVVWTGWVDHDELPAFYRLADALVMPSLYEACPSPPLEAMASGCPVVTSDRYGTREIAGGAAILVNPESVESIAQGMESALTEESLRQHLREAGRLRAGQFTWNRCARETLKVIEDAEADHKLHP